LRAAGVYNITFSLESASPRIQELINKHLDIARTMQNIRYAHRLGIITKAYFMLGFPTETRVELDRTLALALDPALDMMSLFKVVPFRHTQLAEIARRTWGDDAVSDQSNYFTGRTLYEQKTGIPLGRILFRTYIKFYSPWRIWRLLVRLPRRGAFLKRLGHHVGMILRIR
jgi:hypothetical protein